MLTDTATAATIPAAAPATGQAPPARPRWYPPALAGLLLGTAALYLIGLGASGWANAYYSAAAQAAAVSWKALLFGATDAGNAITVDKTPAAVWLMGLSARLFGVNAWSILVPQALAGVGAVALLAASVRRVAGAAAGLLAGAALALTPVATLMFRFNNPDALLVLLLVAAAYATLRATERANPRWLLLAGTLVGFGFLTKMLQAFLVLPAFALAYLIAAPTSPLRRVGHLLAAGGAMVLAAGWWVLLVQLWPANARPYIGGSQTNSVLELMFGYNGFGRLTGDEVGSVGGGGSGSGSWARLLGSEMGTQIAWLLPAAVVLLAGGLWCTRRAPRTDATRAALVLWGGWLLVTAVVFSAMSGIIHSYYTVALAPAIAAVAGIGARVLLRHRGDPVAAGFLAGATALTAVTAFVLLNRADWQPWLGPAVLVAGLAAALLLLAGDRLPAAVRRSVIVLAIVAALAGPSAYSVATAAQAHTGALPTAGPAGSGMSGPGGGTGVGNGGPAGGTRGGAGGVRGSTGGGMSGGMGAGMGGLLDTTTPGTAITRLLGADAQHYTWVAATVGSNNAAGYQLATGAPVLAVGGFNGTDPAPTLAGFQQLVRQGRIHYFVASSLAGMTGNGGSDAARQITAWVEANFAKSTVDGTVIYDLVR